MSEQDITLQPKPLSGLTFTYSNDVNPNDNTVIEDDEVETPPIPPTETVQEVAESLIQAEAPKEVSETETTDPNTFHLILKSFQVTDKLIPDDVEIPENIGGQDFKKILKDAVKKEVLQESAPEIEEREAAWVDYLNSKGYTEEQIAFSYARAQGVGDEVLTKVNQLRQLASAELKSDEEKEYVVRTRLALEGNKKNLIDTHIQTDLNDDEKLTAAAAEAQEVLAQMADAEFQNAKDYAAAQELASKNAREEQRKAYVKIIDKGEIKGVKLSKEEREDLKKYMFSATVVRDVETPEGKRRIAMPQETIDLEELEKDPEQRIFFAYLVKNGLQNAANTLHRSSADDFLKKIETKPVSKLITSSQDDDEFVNTIKATHSRPHSIIPTR